MAFIFLKFKLCRPVFVSLPVVFFVDVGDIFCCPLCFDWLILYPFCVWCLPSVLRGGWLVVSDGVPQLALCRGPGCVFLPEELCVVTSVVVGEA